METLPEELIFRLCGYITGDTEESIVKILKNRLRLSLLCKEYRNHFLSVPGLFSILWKCALENRRTIEDVVELFQASEELKKILSSIPFDWVAHIEKTFQYGDRKMLPTYMQAVVLDVVNQYEGALNKSDYVPLFMSMIWFQRVTMYPLMVDEYKDWHSDYSPTHAGSEYVWCLTELKPNGPPVYGKVGNNGALIDLCQLWPLNSLKSYDVPLLSKQRYTIYYDRRCFVFPGYGTETVGEARQKIRKTFVQIKKQQEMYNLFVEEYEYFNQHVRWGKISKRKSLLNVIEKFTTIQ